MILSTLDNYEKSQQFCLYGSALLVPIFGAKIFSLILDLINSLLSRADNCENEKESKESKSTSPNFQFEKTLITLGILKYSRNYIYQNVFACRWNIIRM